MRGCSNLVVEPSCFASFSELKTLDLGMIDVNDHQLSGILSQTDAGDDRTWWGQWWYLSERFTEIIKFTPLLQRLVLIENDQLTDHAIEMLEQHLPGLKHLVVHSAQLTDHAFHHASKLRCLQHLNLADGTNWRERPDPSSHFTDAGVQPVFHMRTLNFLLVYSIHITIASQLVDGLEVDIYNEPLQ